MEWRAWMVPGCAKSSSSAANRPVRQPAAGAPFTANGKGRRMEHRDRTTTRRWGRRSGRGWGAAGRLASRMVCM
eukprot:3219066-Rhodomonas_salina.1